jgi:protocatechuate 3,4-dioxygenase beta subunit
VTITLKNKANTKVADQTATTAEDGSFHFNNVFPGTYEVVASHPSWTFVKVCAAIPSCSRACC